MGCRGHDAKISLGRDFLGGVSGDETSGRVVWEELWLVGWRILGECREQQRAPGLGVGAAMGGSRRVGVP